MKSLKNTVVFLFCIMAIVSVAFSNPISRGDNTISTSPECLKAHLIIKFAEHIYWPSQSSFNNPHAPFVIGIIDAPAISSYLTELTAKITVNEKKVKVINITDLTEIKQCQVLFISELSRKDLQLTLKAIGDLPILTIGDSPGCEKKGIMINLFFSTTQQCIKYALNCQAAQKTGISLTSKVVRFADSVIK